MHVHGILGQKSVCLSTAESEYVALSGCVQEVIWVRRVLSFLGFEQDQPTVVYEDNEAAMALANNSCMTKRARFIDVRFHYVREMVADGQIKVVRCPTALMVADLFTKSLSLELIKRHWGVVSGLVEVELPQAVLVLVEFQTCA